VDTYSYDYDYETALDDEAIFDVEQLNIDYVDNLALAADEVDPELKDFRLDNSRHGSASHRRRRPSHARYIIMHLIDLSASCFDKTTSQSAASMIESK